MWAAGDHGVLPKLLSAGSLVCPHTIWSSREGNFSAQIPACVLDTNQSDAWAHSSGEVPKGILAPANMCDLEKGRKLDSLAENCLPNPRLSFWPECRKLPRIRGKSIAKALSTLSSPALWLLSLWLLGKAGWKILQWHSKGQNYFFIPADSFEAWDLVTAGLVAWENQSCRCWARTNGSGHLVQLLFLPLPRPPQHTQRLLCISYHLD